MNQKKRKRNPLTPVGRLVIPTGVKGSCNVAALAGPFNTGSYYQPVLKRGPLVPVAQTGTKGLAFSPGRAAPAREPGQQALPDRC